MNDKPILSICIPTYNGAKYITQNLDVIIRQINEDNIRDVEVIVSDNCSTDETPSLVMEYVERYPKIIRYSRNEKNILFNGNMLKCCGLAYGKFIHFLGDDDFYHPHGIQRIVETLHIDDSYSVLIASNNWFLNSEQKCIPRGEGDGLYCQDITLNSSLEFARIASYRLWCVSDLIINKQYLENINKFLPNIDDWIQISIALYVASKREHYYYFSDKTPVLSIRIGTQTWMNNLKAPDIYLNNLRTFMYSKKYGFNSDFIEYEKDIFLKHAPAHLIKSINFFKNVKLIFFYFKILHRKKKFYRKILPPFFKRAKKQ